MVRNALPYVATRDGVGRDRPAGKERFSGFGHQARQGRFGSQAGTETRFTRASGSQTDRPPPELSGL